MQYIIIALAAIIVVQLLTRKKPAAKEFSKIETESETIKETLDFRNAYQKKWMFSYNEKDALQALKTIAEPKGYYVFAKVRLFDLVEPVKNNPKYKTFLYKIQSKHVDFVICDSKLVARYIVELDDNSHERQDRKDRDTFVDTVLKSVGYKILHTRAITQEAIEALLKEEM